MADQRKRFERELRGALETCAEAGRGLSRSELFELGVPRRWQAGLVAASGRVAQASTFQAAEIAGEVASEYAAEVFDYIDGQHKAIGDDVGAWIDANVPRI